MTRVAVVQMDPELGAIERNLADVDATMQRLASNGVELAVFPECALTGYLYQSLDEAMGVAEEIPGPTSDRLCELARRHSMYAVIGMLEREGERCFNTALLVSPRGVVAHYRKTHTLCLGVDRFTTPGETPFTVLTLPFGRIGILICYDLRFPEPARALALGGAQAILLPTNWPVASTLQPDVFTRSRAAENRVFVLAANRVGEERGASFLGRSQIVDPDGVVRHEGSFTSPEALIADINLADADEKNDVVSAGEHEMNCIEDRRPHLYGSLVAQLETAPAR